MDDDSAVLPAIGGFLSADDPGKADAWRKAIVVDDAMLSAPSRVTLHPPPTPGR